MVEPARLTPDWKGPAFFFNPVVGSAIFSALLVKIFGEKKEEKKNVMIAVHNIEIWRRLSVAFKYQQGKMILHFLDYFKCQPNL